MLRDEQIEREVSHPVATATQPTPPTLQEKPISTILVYRDGRQSEVQNYAVLGKTLWVFAGQTTRKVPLSDLDMDVTTAARFHFGEMFFSTGFLSIALVVLGVAPLAFVIFFIAFEAATCFHHSNWRLPIKLERILNLILVTPRMHGIHHSIVERETNSNWGTIFCWWDKLHRTMRRDISQDALIIGVAAYRDEHELTLGKLLALPFCKQREWRLPSGERPDRAPQPADKLAE